jgi:hypothetical protein
MNRIFKVAVLLLAAYWCISSLALAQQRRARATKPKPETSQDSSFDPKQLTKLAVLVVGSGPSRGLARGNRDTLTDQQRLVEDEFVEILLQKGYSLVSRSDIQAVIKEQRFQKSGLTEDNAVDVGKLLNVPAVLVVSVTTFSAENQVNQRTRKSFLVGIATLGARLVSVESGAIWWSGTHGETRAINGRAEARDVLAYVAKNVAAAFPDRGAEGGSSSASSFDPKGLTKLAVVVVGSARSGNPVRGGQDNLTAQQRLVEDEFVRVLLQKGYSLVSRSDIEAVVKEQRFQKSGLTPEDAVEVGKLLNVPAVLVVRVTDTAIENQRSLRTNTMVLVGKASLGARLVSAESGLILWSRAEHGSQEVANRSGASYVLAQTAKKVAVAFPDKNGPKRPINSGAVKKPASARANSAPSLPQN